ncbi:MAG: aldo/keto reductase, partial [Hominenteromicrobium sp.]
ETHVFQQQKTAHEYMVKYGVQHESWGPFAEGRKDFFSNPVLTQIGEKHGKSAAQIALRFLIQSGVVVIPKSTHKERMIQNISVFDFALDDADMAAIQALDEAQSLFFSHYDPATVEMLTGLHR